MSGDLSRDLRESNLRNALRERFHKVILSAGYSEIAAKGILEEWFEKYMLDIPSFVKMMENYEKNDGDPE